MKLRKKLMFLIFVASLLPITLLGCQDSPNPPVEIGPEPQVRKTFAVVFPIEHPFFEPVGKNAEEFGAEYGWDVIIRAPESANAKLQIQIIEELIEAQVDGIAIGPTDPDALTDVINSALDSEIKVICFETDSPNSNRMGYVGTDNYKAGRHMGFVIGKQLNGNGQILILTGLSTQMSLNERIRGIREYLGENHPDIAILAVQSSEGNAERAVEVLKDMIEEYPDFDALVGIDATAGPAAISTWKEYGWTGNDKLIIPFDDMPKNLQGLRDGYVKSIVSQRQQTWGMAVLLLLNSLTEGREIPDYTDTGSIEITMYNIDSYFNEKSWVEPQ